MSACGWCLPTLTSSAWIRDLTVALLVWMRAMICRVACACARVDQNVVQHVEGCEEVGGSRFRHHC